MMTLLKVVLPLLVTAWTIWGVYDRKLKAALARGERQALIREYKISVAGELVGGILAVAAIGTVLVQVDPRFNIELSDFGIQLMIGVLAGTIISFVVAPIAARKGKGMKVAGDIDAMIPRSSTEKVVVCRRGPCGRSM